MFENRDIDMEKEMNTFINRNINNCQYFINTNEIKKATKLL